MKLKNHCAVAAIFLAAATSLQAATVFTDTFNYTVDNAMVAEGGWTAWSGGGGSDAGTGKYWGGGNNGSGNDDWVEYNYTTTLSEGDVISMDANVLRIGSTRGYTMTIDLWDGADGSTRALAAGGVQDTPSSAALTTVTYTATSADVGKQVIFKYSHTNNWGETADVTFDVTAVPEPSSAALLGLGGIALILRRRK